MNASSVALLTFAATVLLVFSVSMLAYDWFFRYRILLDERVREIGALGSQGKTLQLFRDLKRAGDNELSARTLTERLSHLLEQAGFSCSVEQFVRITLLSGLACGICGIWVQPACAVAFVVLGITLPFVVVFLRRQVRRRRLCRQLPDAFQMISRAVRAGQTVPAALKIIADDFEAPISEEFSLCYDQQNLGVSREAALRKLAQRSGIMELQIFVVALLVQAKSGGNLVELLDNLALTIRKRFKLSDRVRALTGEGRMQARILLVLPVAALIGLLVLSPDYALGIVEFPWLLTCTAAAQAVGAFWIRRIVNFQY